MSLQQFIDSYRKARPDDVLEIDEKISVDYEPTCYANELGDRNPMLLFNRVDGYDGIRLINNIFGTKERIAFSLGCAEKDLYSRWNDIINRKNGKISIVSDAQVKEVIYGKDYLNLLRLPAPRHYEEDGGRYISGGLIAARNPADSNIINLSFARIQLVDKDKAALSMHSRGHLWNYYLLSKKAGKPLPVTVIIGAHPIYYMAAAAHIEDEYSKIGSVIEPKLTEGITNDIPVPANAEIAFEGEISPTEEFHEGPFGEYTGYMSNRSTNNLMHIRSLYMKSNPFFLDINPSNAKEHVLLSSVAKEAPMMQEIKQFMPPNEYSLNWPTASSHYMAIGSIRRPEPGLAKQLGIIMLGLDHYLKIVIVGDGEGEMKFRDLMGRLARSSSRVENMDILPGIFCNRLDPSASPEGTSSKVIFVANSHDNAATASVGVEDSLVLSHTYRDDGGLNIILDDDIDLSNDDEIIWALSTRLQPAEGIRTVDGRIVIDSRRPNLLRPTMPEDVVQRVRAKVRSLRAVS
ncbi:MAG: UbiD family decarboxylase [Nitrososphaerota archaeon]|nr:UbiD family decarboxylase [Nitrososphaerota archaeon]MDG7041023.1 UbiD family decarboxylase [Nitrososphaerota archaeon]MDG7045774.1 UbiD family decarboxylase [Nitrososphaerota archaeon]